MFLSEGLSDVSHERSFGRSLRRDESEISIIDKFGQLSLTCFHALPHYSFRSCRIEVMGKYQWSGI